MDRVDRFLCILAMVLMLCYVIGTICSMDIYAAELDQEETSSFMEDVGADEELLLFGYLTEPEEQAVTLARIYNVLLTILYVMLINIGRQIIVRNLRKGQLKHGLAE